ncbi:enoyl-CoA hydratase/isomerase family protein [Mycolicibacterium baixiangningiae]|uniref:enoyl-CoA hydratase/isomerase family protein n=1 Tax=Mycolicibacterium baixiangningiae TaxID=2761578 RepID=UPI001867D2DD|nr:enoyl-CoA hydratase/isomerase family protein [Mycolicibacterium baixiangningiae]
MADAADAVEHVTDERVAPGIVSITLNRARTLNVLSKAMLERLIDLITTYGCAEDIRVIILTGEGRAFSAGGDVRAINAMTDEEYAPYLETYAELDRAIRNCSVPVIAALNGLTYGGGLEIACMADIRVADADAVLCAGDLAIGLLPTGGLTWKLPRFIGAGRARWMLLTNAELDAVTARDIGLVDEVAPSGTALQQAIELAGKLQGFTAEGVGLTKRALKLAETGDEESSYDFEVRSNVDILLRQETKSALRRRFPPRDDAPPGADATQRSFHTMDGQEGEDHERG